MSLRFDWMKGTVKRDLMEVPDKLLDGAYEALMDLAHLMSGLAKVHVRVDTGSLRDSIRVERAGKAAHWAMVRVRAGGYIVNPRTGRLVDYAAIVEAKYPYMKPAWNEVRGQAEDLIRRKCLAEVARMESALG